MNNQEFTIWKTVIAINQRITIRAAPASDQVLTILAGVAHKQEVTILAGVAHDQVGVGKRLEIRENIKCKWKILLIQKNLSHIKYRYHLFFIF